MQFTLYDYTGVTPLRIALCINLKWGVVAARAREREREREIELLCSGAPTCRSTLEVENELSSSVEADYTAFQKGCIFECLKFSSGDKHQACIIL